MDTLIVMTASDDVLPELARYGPVLSPSEVAQILVLNVDVVARLMREGKLPGFRAGGSWRMRRSDLQAVMTGTWQSPREDD